MAIDKIEVKIGETIEIKRDYGIIKAVAVEDVDNKGCDICCLKYIENCESYKCDACCRTDGKNVYFEEVKK